MCGIVGFYSGIPVNFSAVISSMTSRISHRGPDGSGIWVDFAKGLALGHRRLSILDLSDAGRQPMTSSNKRYVIIFNGEIYNHLDLRKKISSEGRWVGGSDTETLLRCIEEFGLTATLTQIVGMFSFALWDCERKTLTLARDRVGEKPLYYGWSGQSFFFGSDLAAFKPHPEFDPDIDRNSLTLFLRHNCIPEPYSIYDGIFKLSAGNYLQLSYDDLNKRRAPRPSSYWSLDTVVKSGLESPFSGDSESAINLLDTTLRKSIASQLQADVPVGAFLSGGIDSSVVAALMQQESKSPIKTFSIGFEDSNFNEAHHAHAVADYIRSEHTELYVTPRDALNIIPQMASIYSEPFSDSSQIPTTLLCKMAREHVSVALSGDGGDELFCGYNRYLAGMRVWNFFRQWPDWLKSLLVKIIHSVPPSKWDAAFSYCISFLPAGYSVKSLGEKMYKFAGVLSLKERRDFYLQLTSHWSDPASVVLGGREPLTKITDAQSFTGVSDFRQWMMAMDAKTYMTDDILTKVDRAAMANGLETRLPFLDHRVIELAWRMPMHNKVRNGEGKWMLRQVLYRYVPRSLIDRPKQGFGLPLGDWLKGPLRDWVESLIGEARLSHEGFFDPKPIRRLWEDYLLGNNSGHHLIWDVLMFQSWLDNQKV